MKRLGALFGLVFVAAACGSTPSTTPQDQPQTWVGVYYPAGWTPSQPMSLELAGSAWDIPAKDKGFNGVMIVYRDGPVEVRLYGVDDCTVYAAFRADNGSSHTIRFDVGRGVTVEDITGSAIEFGPGLNERELTGCDE